MCLWICIFPCGFDYFKEVWTTHLFLNNDELDESLNSHFEPGFMV